MRLLSVLDHRDVFLSTVAGGEYDVPIADVFPELPDEVKATAALAGVRTLFRDARLHMARHGTAEWNPLSQIIEAGSRVLLKPNWVTHSNRSGAGLDALITHTSVIEAVAIYALLARPLLLTIGDAPIQGCDFDALRSLAGIDDMMARLQPIAERMGTHVQLADFRLRVLPHGRLEARTDELLRSEDQYVRFDMARHSQLEPITESEGQFRVTMYDPDALQRTHAPGKHQYLIAREAIEADVILNVPKLKCHKKACVTGAIKNLVGVNGHKEYLPHHRKGGAGSGGDCYPGRSPVKRAVEELYDITNRSRSPRLRYLLPRLAWIALRGYRTFGRDGDVEGSWHGNDTVWRMCLDLQRVVHYGRADGTLDVALQRRVVTITDAVVAGEGEGPLAPTPVKAGLLTLSGNPIAAEWVHSLFMGFDPRRVPIVVRAFEPHSYPLVSFAPSNIRVTLDGGRVPMEDIPVLFPRSFVPSRGWIGHCELAKAQAVS